MTGKIKVMIVDDSALVRQVVAAALARGVAEQVVALEHIAAAIVSFGKGHSP